MTEAVGILSGILSWGVHIPAHRLPVSLLAGHAAAPERTPERAVSWVDEDSLTMAVAAARRALAGRPRAEIDLLVFASTTHPFAEKQGAALIAAVLGLREDVRTLDLGQALRAGVEALLLARDAIAAGQVKQALVIAADCRMGAPGSELERSGGDAAAAFLLGKGAVAATLTADACQTQEIVASWRRNGDPFVHDWEKRFVGQYGFLAPALAAARSLPVAPEGVARHWATSAPDRRAARQLQKALGASHMVPGLLETVGFSGTAHALLLLAAALEGTTKGAEIAVVAHGDGAAALLLKRQAAPGPQGTVATALAARIPVTSLTTYRRARQLERPEYPPTDGPGISATIHFRERAENLSLRGQRCQCGTPQFPRQRVCSHCGAKDHFTPQSFAEAGGRLLTYSLDAFFPSPTPPTAVGVVEVQDGPRLYLQLTDLPETGPEIGMPLAFVFRCIHEVGRRPNYFWKAVPQGRGQ